MYYMQRLHAMDVRSRVRRTNCLRGVCHEGSITAYCRGRAAMGSQLKSPVVGRCGDAHRGYRWWGGAIAMLLLALVSATAPALAASFLVTTTFDAPHLVPLSGFCDSTLSDHRCSLRAAIQAANFLGGGPHTIRFCDCSKGE